MADFILLYLPFIYSRSSRCHYRLRVRRQSWLRQGQREVRDARGVGRADAAERVPGRAVSTIGDGAVRHTSSASTSTCAFTARSWSRTYSCTACAHAAHPPRVLTTDGAGVQCRSGCRGRRRCGRGRREPASCWVRDVPSSGTAIRLASGYVDVRTRTCACTGWCGGAEQPIRESTLAPVPTSACATIPGLARV